MHRDASVCSRETEFSFKMAAQEEEKKQNFLSQVIECQLVNRAEQEPGRECKKNKPNGTQSVLFSHTVAIFRNEV